MDVRMKVTFRLEPIDCNTSQGLCFSLSYGKRLLRSAALFDPRNPIDAVLKLRRLANQLEESITEMSRTE